MSLLPHQIELLSPARDAGIGIEAVNHGADAVYIGGPAFGARAGACNDIRELERLIAHAHRFHSRVFITFNTILRDDELEDARQMAWQVYNAGADALIIQDMGLLELDLPPIQLHASTQTDIRTPEKAHFLQDAGLSQIVLKQGEEMGRFLLGSTVVMLFPQGPLQFNPAWAPARPIRLGEAMARMGTA